MSFRIKFIFLLGVLATLFVGDAPFLEMFKSLSERFQGTIPYHPFVDERIPRLLVLMMTGASLATAGAIMQGLFQNPLASPSVLGITSGASLAATAVFLVGWHTSHPEAVPFAAFSGSLATLFVVWCFAKRAQTALILTGIAFSTLLLAIQGAIMWALKEHWELMETITEWEAGSTTDRSFIHVNMQFPLCLIGLGIAWRYRRELDRMSLGDEEALNLGVEVDKVRFRLFLSTALLVGGAIASVGAIGFFGLVLPHLIREMNGPSHEKLIPLSIILGALSLMLLDLVLRLFSLHLFSIGNISAILGGVFFLILLFKQQSRSYA